MSSKVSGLTLRMLLMGMSVKVPVGTAAKAGAAGGLGVGAAGEGAAAGAWWCETCYLGLINNAAQISTELPPFRSS